MASPEAARLDEVLLALRHAAADGRAAVPVPVDVTWDARWLADPILAEPLRAIVERGGLDPETSTLAAQALARCDPAAPAEAERFEGALLAALQASAAEAGIEGIDVALRYEYPRTALVVRLGGEVREALIWDFDEREPTAPATIDEAFTMYRLANVARWF